MGFSDSDSDYVRHLLLSRSANPSRNTLFAANLKPAARMADASNADEAVSTLRIDPGPHLRCTLAEAMTIHETSFFRDAKMFDALHEIVFPRLIETNSATRKLRIWSAAGSSGQEAYSMAMLICEHFEAPPDWDVKIVGTDISREVIEYARLGRYRRLEVNRGLPARMLVKYLARDGEEWEIAPRLRSMCEFQCANLCEPMPLLPEFDLVMLRNVLLYFTPQDRTAVFQSVHRRMAPGGYLVLGASEQAEDSTKLFQAEFKKECCFYRPSSGLRFMGLREPLRMGRIVLTASNVEGR